MELQCTGSLPVLWTVCSAAVVRQRASCGNSCHIKGKAKFGSHFGSACVLHSINKRLNQQWYAYTATLLHGWELTCRPSPMAYEAAEGLRLFPVVDELPCNSSVCLCGTTSLTVDAFINAISARVHARNNRICMSQGRGWAPSRRHGFFQRSGCFVVCRLKAASSNGCGKVREEE